MLIKQNKKVNMWFKCKVTHQTDRFKLKLGHNGLYHSCQPLLAALMLMITVGQAWGVVSDYTKS